MKISNQTKEKIMNVLGILFIVAVFGIVGEMDYQDQLMAEQHREARSE